MCLYGFVSSNINLNTEALSYLSDKKFLHGAPPPFLLGDGRKGGGESPAKFSKRGCLTGLVSFKRWDGVKDEKFKYEGSLKTSIFGGRFHAKPIYRGELPKKGGELREKEAVVFLGGLIPQCTLL